MKSLFVFGTLSLFVVAGCTVDTADVAPETDIETSEEALSAKTRIAAGSFDLAPAMDHVPNPACDPHTTLVLKNAPAAKVTLREVVGGFCELAVFPNERTFNVRLESESCGSKVYAGTRGRGANKSSIRVSDHRGRRCHDLPANLELTIEETVPGFPGAITTTQYAVNRPAPTPPAPTFCAAGRVVAEPSFVPSADGLECSVPNLHCVTRTARSCPQLSPPSPDFCKDGTIVSGPANFFASADGMECQLPSLHCVTKDAFACPMFSPLSPDFCKDGTIVPAAASFTASSDGKECRLPGVHCVTNDSSSCPQF